MFQYAAARALSLRLGESLAVDVASFSDCQMHQGFELSHVFKCNVQLATENNMQKELAWRGSKKVRALLLKPQFKWLRGRVFLVEPSFDYWPGFQGIDSGCYLSGYWQSEKYFRPFARAIRQDFTFRLPLQGKSLKLAQQMATCNSVSLHVRRGDYVSNAQTYSTHGVCSLDYYRAATAYISDKVESPYFFVFSDDIGWCKENVDVGFPCTYIDHNRGRESYRDMQLMSFCHHHIIANSSFSWWGAWLNPSAGKTVIAPKRWFAKGPATNDLIPLDWVVL